jgi:hypothetical protein
MHNCSSLLLCVHSLPAADQDGKSIEGCITGLDFRQSSTTPHEHCGCALQKERLQRPARCPDPLWQLIEVCWTQDPRDRPSFADIQQKLQQMQQQLAETQQAGTSADSSGQEKDSRLAVQQQQQLSQQGALEATPDPFQQQQQQQQGGKLPAQAASAQGQPVEESEEVDAHVAVVC